MAENLAEKVAATLTEDGRRRWLQAALSMYPKLAPAEPDVVAVLAWMEGEQSFPRHMQPWWDTHGQRLTMDLLCDAVLLSHSARLAIIATDGAQHLDFALLAEVVARAAAAGEVAVVDLELIPENPDQGPDDGQYHGAELDAAMAMHEGPTGMGVCLTALASRRDAHVDQQVREARFATDVLLGDEPSEESMPRGEGVAEAMRKALLELKAGVEQATGEEMSREDATLLALRTTFGGSFSTGIEVGLNLARNRQQRQREWEVEHYLSGGATLLTSPGEGVEAGEYVLVEKGKL